MLGPMEIARPNSYLLNLRTWMTINMTNGYLEKDDGTHKPRGWIGF